MEIWKGNETISTNQGGYVDKLQDFLYPKCHLDWLFLPKCGFWNWSVWFETSGVNVLSGPKVLTCVLLFVDSWTI